MARAYRNGCGVHRDAVPHPLRSLESLRTDRSRMRGRHSPCSTHDRTTGVPTTPRDVPAAGPCNRSYATSLRFMTGHRPPYGRPDMPGVDRGGDRPVRPRVRCRSTPSTVEVSFSKALTDTRPKSMSARRDSRVSRPSAVLRVVDGKLSPAAATTAAVVNCEIAM